MDKKEKWNKWYEKNKDYRREYCKQYRKENTELVKKWKKDWALRNKDKIKEMNKRYNDKNRERIRERNREYERKNRDKAIARVKKWRENNLERAREIGRVKEFRRRFRLTQVQNDLSADDLKLIIERDKACVYCKSKQNPSFDHVKPLSKGGANTFSNIVLSCLSCNQSKNNRDVEEWCREKGYEIPKIIKEKLIEMRGNKL